MMMMTLMVMLAAQVQASAPVYISVLQRRKRGDTPGYWFKDCSLLICRSSSHDKGQKDDDATGPCMGSSRSCWRPVVALIRGPTRAATAETLLEAGATYLIVPFSVTSASSDALSEAHQRQQKSDGAPAVLRLYGGARQRSRPSRASLSEVKLLRGNVETNLAPFHAFLCRFLWLVLLCCESPEVTESPAGCHIAPSSPLSPRRCHPGCRTSSSPASPRVWAPVLHPAASRAAEPWTSGRAPSCWLPPATASRS